MVNNNHHLPEEPLLRPAELRPPVLDLREELEPPLRQYLLPNEQVVRIIPVSKKRRENHPSSLEAMIALTNSSSALDIGYSGPSIASLAFPENRSHASLTKFESVFGRDSLITAFMLHEMYPELMRTTLLRLAGLQGNIFDPRTGEEPGGILHDNHDTSDPVARKFIELCGWRFPFYATVDATPLFINGIVSHLEHDPGFLDATYTDKAGNKVSIADGFRHSVNWLCRRIGQNEEGLLEYYNIEASNMENMSWKDSYHSYIHADGSFANHELGIASIEVQGYAYDALLNAASVYSTYFGDDETANSLRAQALQIKRVVLERFWVDDDGGYFGLGADRDESGNFRLMSVKSSNMGHLLASKILDGDEPDILQKRAAIIKHLFSPRMLNVAGVRTLAADELGFNPYSYHNGGVWPHDNAWIAMGLERHGYYGLAWEINKRIWKTIDVTGCFPEVVQGGTEPSPKLSEKCVYVWDDSRDMIYLLERPPQEIQAWVVAAILRAKSKNPIPNSPKRNARAMPKEALEQKKKIFEQEILKQVD